MNYEEMLDRVYLAMEKKAEAKAKKIETRSSKIIKQINEEEQCSVSLLLKFRTEFIKNEIDRLENKKVDRININDKKLYLLKRQIERIDKEIGRLEVNLKNLLKKRDLIFI